jgi:hypothetical protein
MGKEPSILDVLAAIQVERNHKIYIPNADWNNYYKLIVELAELKSKINIERMAKYRREHPDFA